MLSEDGTPWLKGLAQLYLPLTHGTASPAIDTCMQCSEPGVLRQSNGVLLERRERSHILQSLLIPFTQYIYGTFIVFHTGYNKCQWCLVLIQVSCYCMPVPCVFLSHAVALLHPEVLCFFLFPPLSHTHTHCSLFSLNQHNALFLDFLFPLQLYILSPITVNFFALLVKCYTFLKVHLLSGQGGVRYIPPYTVCIGRHTHNTDQGSKERCRGSSIKFASSTT